MTDPISKHVAEQKDVPGWARNVALPIFCRDGTILSVQASKGHQCQPRNDAGPWTHFEVSAGPATDPAAVAEELGVEFDAAGVAAFVPLANIQRFVALHRGLDQRHDLLLREVIALGHTPDGAEPDGEPAVYDVALNADGTLRLGVFRMSEPELTSLITMLIAYRGGRLSMTDTLADWEARVQRYAHIVRAPAGAIADGGFAKVARLAVCDIVKREFESLAGTPSSPTLALN